jgi:hypothetical protein
MEGSEREIEIIKPFNDAIELTKLILFRPFDFSKWLVIGFAAFLSNLSGGSFNFNFDFGNWPNSHFLSESESWPWLLPLIVLGGIIVIALVLLFLWIGSRGIFIFTDCIVRNRAAIKEPWREYRGEGNSLFLFSLAAIAILLLVAAIAAVPLFLLWPGGHGSDLAVGFIIALCLVVPLLFLLFMAWALIQGFMVPVMYRQRCNALTAFQKIISLVAAHPGEMVLFILFSFVLVIGAVIVMVVATCATCCLALIPYIGTVILLPLHVFGRSYLLLFLRQFGPEHDAWGGRSPLLATPPALPGGA